MRYFLFLVTAVFFADTVALTIRKSFTFGYIVMLFLTIVFLCISVFYCQIKLLTQTGFLKFCKIGFIRGWAFVLLMTIFLMSKSVTRVTYNENAVIVLGCGLNTDGTPSETLKKRLDGCLDYYSKNSNCVIVVSGGHDRHADISEAEGMKIYLINNGIPENKIFLEDKSQSTRENFDFSKQLLIENNIDYNSSVYITNSFHIYRAGLYAEQSGFESVNPLRVKTDIVVYIPAVLREIIAVCAVKLLNY